MSKRKKAVKPKKKSVTKESCALVCPKCGTYWATMRFQFGSCVNPEDVTVLVGEKKFATGDDLACVCCGYVYSGHDVILAIADPKTKLKPGEKIPVPPDTPEHFDAEGVEIPNGAEETSRVVQVEEAARVVEVDIDG